MKRDIGLFLVFCFLITTFTGCTGSETQTNVRQATGPGKSSAKPGARIPLDTSKMNAKEKIQVDLLKNDVRQIFAFLYLADHLFDQAWAVIHDQPGTSISNVFQGTANGLRKLFGSDAHPDLVTKESCEANKGLAFVKFPEVNGYQLVQGKCPTSANANEVASFVRISENSWVVRFEGSKFTEELGNLLSLYEHPECEFTVDSESRVLNLSCKGVGQDSPTSLEPLRYIQFSEITFNRDEKIPLVIRGESYKDLEAGLQKRPSQKLGLIDVPAENALKFHVDVTKLPESEPDPAAPPVALPTAAPAAEPPTASREGKAPVDKIPGNNNGEGNNNGLGNNNGDPLPKVSRSQTEPTGARPTTEAKPKSNQQAEALLNGGNSEPLEEIAAGQQGDGG